MIVSKSTPMFIAALFTTAKIRKQPNGHWWWIKVLYLYTMTSYLFIKKEEILLFATTWMEREGIMLCEISQRKINSVWSLLYVESRKNELTGTENRMVVDSSRAWWSGELGEGGQKVKPPNKFGAGRWEVSDWGRERGGLPRHLLFQKVWLWKWRGRLWGEYMKVLEFIPRVL